jgi:hypothetical protein
MSILNGQAVPTRVVAVLRALHRAGNAGQTAAELMAVMLPDPVRLRNREGRPTENVMVPDSLAAAEAIGLVEPAERTDAYHLTADGRGLGDPSDANYHERCIAEFARRLAGPRADAGGEQYRLMRWVWAWYLDLRPEEVPGDSDGFWRAVDGIRPPGCDKVSTVPYGQFLHWGEAVGLLTPLRLKGPTGGERTVIVADPTTLLRRHLGEFMPAGRDVQVDEWAEELARRFVVFDGGSVRAEVRSARRAAPTDREFSPSLELALRRLRDEGVLTWRPETDTPSYFLTLGATEPVAYLTHRPGGRS